MIRETLAAHGLGVVLKTHDGTEWMSRYDDSSTAIHGPASIKMWADFFERGGVPFHAWAVVEGKDPEAEARMASEVLDAGARGLFLDLESYEGFWTGTPEDATRFGEEFRALQPTARLSVSVDPRPWELERLPLAEFAAFSDEIAPQVYWGLFSSPSNIREYHARGEAVGEDGITPEFVLSSTMKHLGAYGLPIHPIGDGTVEDGWEAFVTGSGVVAADSVSVWRYGVASTAVWDTLRDNPPSRSSHVAEHRETFESITARNTLLRSTIPIANGLVDHTWGEQGLGLCTPRATQLRPGSCSAR